MDIKIGDKFGYLKVIGNGEQGKKRKSYICRCICGKILTLGRYSLIGCPNRRPNKSCGCKQLKQGGYAGKYTRLYGIWMGMIKRCYNPNDLSYERYGNKGITVCQEWLDSYEDFAKWSISNNYNDSLTIDRINSNIGYAPYNCRWITAQEQTINRKVFKNNKCGVTGVDFVTRSSKYRASISRDGKRMHLGLYNTLDDAVSARRKAEEYYEKNNTLIGFIL